MLENLRLAFQGIWSHKLRSFLTMLGIIIGIAAIIAIVSTIQGTNEQIKRNLIGSGTNTVKIQLCQNGYPVDLSYATLPDSIPVITEEIRQQIVDIDEVSDATLYHDRNDYSNDVFYLNQSLSGGHVTGIDSHYLNVFGYVLVDGRGFTQADHQLYRKVALVDQTAAETLFPGEDPIGKTIEIKKEPFTVIGLVRLSNQFEPVIKTEEDYYTYHSDNSGGSVLIPDADWPILYAYDEPQNCAVRATSTDTMTQAGTKAAAILNENAGLKTASAGSDSGAQAGTDENAAVDYGTSEDSGYQYKNEDLLEQARQLQELSESTNRMLVWIAAISLLVGGIGVMNIMLVSVSERTREIGLKKAIGAKKKNIMGQFLTEAAVLTSLGGIVGVIMGFVLARVYASMNGTLAVISVPAVLISVGFSMVIGIVFGLLPSIRAANLNPIDALRYE